MIPKPWFDPEKAFGSLDAAACDITGGKRPVKVANEKPCQESDSEKMAELSGY